MELWIVRGLAVVLTALSAFGFLNALYLHHHGPGGDLGVIAGILAIAAFWGARSIQKNP
jgi:hypothetical protein